MTWRPHVNPLTYASRGPVALVAVARTTLEHASRAGLTALSGAARTAAAAARSTARPERCTHCHNAHIAPEFARQTYAYHACRPLGCWHLSLTGFRAGIVLAQFGPWRAVISPALGLVEVYR